jgi:MYXO-CTERM domain-containing protein
MHGPGRRRLEGGCYNQPMVGSSFLRLSSVLAFFAASVPVPSAFAQIMEPDGFGPIPADPRKMCSPSSSQNPKPAGSIGCTGTSDTGDFACCSNTLDNMSLIGLFKYFESDTSGNILVDFQKDAMIQPATFNPLCNIKGTMVMHGGGCIVDFGWYCADPSNSYANQPKIHPLVTATQVYNYATQANPPFPTQWKNNDGAFLPKTSYFVDGTPLSNIANDPDFKNCASKKIGFAIVGTVDTSSANPICSKTNAGCSCTQNKYTEQSINQVNAGGKPYIDAVIYASKNVPGRFYIGIEDLPTSATRFAEPYKHGTETWTADGDFNDFVYTVEGIVCQGGGQLCSVPGRQGLCATGVTSCVDPNSGVQPTCDPVFNPLPETCNAIDDDCNGQIDDGSNLCPAQQICYKGTCVGNCVAIGEFICPAGQVCSADGYCIDAACASANCAADQRCVNGQCVGGCTGVTCSAGQQCVAGKCVDLCDARTAAGLPPCPDNFVCQNGACVPNCNCLPCPDPTQQECQINSSLPGYGRCVATGCADGHCGTQLCVPGGQCVDPCGSNPCPSGQNCTANKNFDPSADANHQYSCSNPDGTVSTGGSSSTQCLGDTCTQGGTGTAGGNGSAAGPNGATQGPANSTGSMGCGCKVASSSMRGWALAGLAGLMLLARSRRRQRPS